MPRKLFAELFATFILIFSGTAAIAANDASDGSVTLIGIALTFGLAVMAMAYAIGDVSGAHLNPAVTIGLCVAKRFPTAEVLPYIGAQCAGALLASGCVRILFPTHETLGGTSPAGSVFQSFLFEVIVTWILMLVVLNVTVGAKEKGIMAGAAIGAVIVLDIFAAGPISGASMNPARSLGPALVSGHLEHLWIYLTAPVLGAILAVGCSMLVREEGGNPPPETKA